MNKIAYQLTRLVPILPDPFSDFSHAGTIPEDFRQDYHRAVALVRQQSITTRHDCLFTDVSKWQGPINFWTMGLAGARGTVMKAGQGYALDPNFKANWKAAKDAGLKRGSYWYFDSRVAPKEQARIWADALREDMGELPHFADYEENYGGSYGGIVNFQMFVLEFQRLTGLPDDKIGIYTGYFYWLEKGVGNSFFGRYWLWIAWYGSERDVLIPKPWGQDKLWGWQFTDSGQGGLFGVSSKEIDLNYFVLGLEEFERLYGATVEPTPNPDTGVNGMFEVWSEVYTMSLRDGNTIAGVKVESHPARTRFICDRIDVPPSSGGIPGDKWAHVTNVGGQPKDLWVAQIHNGVVYCNSKSIQDITNPRVQVQFIDKDGTVWEASNVELIKKS